MSLYSAHSPCKASYHLLIISEAFLSGEGSFPNASCWGTVHTHSVPQSSFIEVYINEVLTWQFLKKQTHVVF